MRHEFDVVEKLQVCVHYSYIFLYTYDLIEIDRRAEEEDIVPLKRAAAWKGLTTWMSLLILALRKFLM